MAEALGVHNTGDTTESYINVAPNWTDANIDGKIVITTAGTVTLVKMKMWQNSITQSGTMTVQLRDKSDGSLLATGSFDLTTIPRGDPAAWYEITVTGSPVVSIDDELYLRAQRDSAVGIAPAWRKEVANFTFMWEVWGDATTLPGAPTLVSPTPTGVTGITLDETPLKWAAGDPAGDTYDVDFRVQGEDWVEVSSAQEALLLAIVFGTLGYGTTYEWRVTATNEYGSTTSDTWSFTCLSYDPPLPTGVTLDGDGVPTGTPTGENNMMTVRRLVAAARNKIFYET